MDRQGKNICDIKFHGGTVRKLSNTVAGGYNEKGLRNKAARFKIYRYMQKKKKKTFFIKKNEILLFAETWMLLHVMSITDCNTE